MTLDESNWSNTVLRGDATLAKAIQILNAGLQIVLITTEENVLIGTITDGDVRRGLISGLEMNSSIQTIVHKNAIVAPAGITKSGARDLMRFHSIEYLPLVDSDRKIVGLLSLRKLSNKVRLRNPFVVMTGGRGERMRPMTDDCPKPMLRVAGKPMLETIIENAIKAGFVNYYFVTHYRSEQIEEYFGDGQRWNIQIEYIEEKSPLGTAGGLSLLDPLPTTPIVVTNGDVLTNIDYNAMLDFHNTNGVDATMAVRSYDIQCPYGVVDLDGTKIIGFAEKPVYRHYVNAGIYVLKPEILTKLESGKPIDMPDFLMNDCLESEEVIAYPIYEDWMDVGNLDDFHAAVQKHS